MTTTLYETDFNLWIEQTVNQLKNGQSFGEIGVYYKTPRTATIIATKLGTHLVSLANKIAYNSL